MRSKNILKLASSITLAQSPGFIGALFGVSSMSIWYTTLTKPSFSPPDWVFGPVWFILYTLMGIALYLVWHRGLSYRRVQFAFSFFLVHLGVNAFWSVAFFGMQNIALALLVILLLWVLILLSTLLFWRIDSRAGALLLPYLLWVSFAVYLNYSLFSLN